MRALASNRVTDSGATSPRGDVLVLGRRRHALGLTWAVTSPPRLEEERRKALGTGSADLWGARRREERQYCLGYKSKGHRPGDLIAGSLAAESDALQGYRGSVLLLIHLPDKRLWLLGLRHGAVIEDEVLAAIEELADDELGKRQLTGVLAEKWNHLLASEDALVELNEVLGITAEAGPSLDRLLAARKGDRLVAAKSRLPFLVGASLVLATVGYLGVAALQDHLANQEAERRRQAAAEAARQQSQLREEGEAVPEWLGKPAATAVAEGCEAAIWLGARATPGWQLSAVTCDGKRVVYQQTRRGGTLFDLETHWRKRQSARVTITYQRQGNEARIEQRFARHGAEISPPEHDAQAVNRLLWLRTQEQREALQLTNINPPPPPPDQKPAVLLVPKVRFSAHTRRTPSSWSASTLPGGATLTEIRLDPRDLSYQIEGVVYAR